MYTQQWQYSALYEARIIDTYHCTKKNVDTKKNK